MLIEEKQKGIMLQDRKPKRVFLIVDIQILIHILFAIYHIEFTYPTTIRQKIMLLQNDPKKKSGSNMV